MSFNWYRGRQLQEATLANGNRVTYKYNEDGLRTYKDTEKTTTTYEWDETKLIRENVTYKKTGKKYDIWYMYDSGNNVIGFEYIRLSEINETLKTTRIYYEKNLQGDVTGLLDEEGAKIASYTYDAWGNVITDNEKSFCHEGYEVPFELNHVLYRGYYYDGSCTDTESDTNLYYLQSRYYDAEVGRFINADSICNLGISGTVFGFNLYSYCDSNPVVYQDKTSEALINVVKKKNWKYWALRSAIAVGGATIGWFAGSLLAKSVASYLKMHPDVVFKMTAKIGSSSFYSIMKFLGINPFTLSMDSGKFIGVARALNSQKITLSYEWAVNLYKKATQFGYKIALDEPHGGYSWHIHLLKNGKRINGIHIQVVKSVWDYLKK